MSTIAVNADELVRTIEENDIVLVDFWAAWCGPCHRFAPVYEQASADHPDLVFAKVDTEVERELSGQLGITSIPTLMAFREQVLVYRAPGALPAPALEQVIQAVEALDMDDVRREIAEQTAAGAEERSTGRATA